jgi:predicted ATPase
VLFITTEGLSRANVVSRFERIVLTPDEAIVLHALRNIEPKIERIASIGTPTRTVAVGVRGGLAMMVAGQRVPIGSMGDGIWRMLGIVLSLVRARGGVLLVDEIDTGLHYSVLVDVWRLVFETARSLDVQVFATTHSRDCYEALAAVTEPGRTEISLQRIERGKVDAVAFTEREIQQAAERGLEVR